MISPGDPPVSEKRIAELPVVPTPSLISIAVNPEPSFLTNLATVSSALSTCSVTSGLAVPIPTSPVSLSNTNILSTVDAAAPPWK